MRFLFVTLLFATLALIKAKITSPKLGDEWKIGCRYNVTWTVDEKSSYERVDLYISKQDQQPPTFVLLVANVTFSAGIQEIVLPSKLIPGNGYVVILAGNNPYVVYFMCDMFSVIRDPSHKEGDCTKYLEDDGANTLGPVPGKTKPEPTTEPEPESTTESEPTSRPEPTHEPEDFCDDECEECDDECGECESDDVCTPEPEIEQECNCQCQCQCVSNDGCVHKDDCVFKDDCKHVDDKHEHENGHDEKTEVVNTGSMNMVTGFWLTLMFVISSILFL